MSPEFTRRQLLAGIGATGGLAAAGLATASSDSPQYTHYTYARSTKSKQTGGQADDEGAGCRIAWWESYNGQVLETQASSAEANVSETLDEETAPTYVADAPGPVISLGNVVPGDEGRLAIGIEAATPEEEEVAVWYRTEMHGTAENGINEPERAAGDETESEGELHEFVEVDIWDDGGVLGGCDGRSWPVIEPTVASGSLAEVFGGTLSDGRQLACLQGGDSDCLGFEWRLPADRLGVNRIQGDSVSFDIAFRTAPCDAGNPFAGGDA